MLKSIGSRHETHLEILNEHSSHLLNYLKLNNQAFRICHKVRIPRLQGSRIGRKREVYQKAFPVVLKQKPSPKDEM